MPNSETGTTSLIGLDMFRKPPLWLSYAATLAAVGLIGFLRLYLFNSQLLSLGMGCR